ncbi:primosomal protein DnaI [Dellaglioa algida]|uniref:Primosomal protein DnaI n=1 Tax=Dellaglioa algida TaxID=105612 RepID=A0A5C6M7A1_9LACO|nr:primosomal protein DnaI [Dellaglioa algida]MDK1716693.1 primosomal protein DnaI [Dellaglioa algida]MDK1720140.1 primosomal protein DnaI [Dellaglioa algida]MDK1721635.1 primosomal protein DnaI [Dellaglioa algida]MDK1723529.1 primosomal protein DnaI [Dellaglioa algida]MDK1725163.1 primosomal protein DnaI [Dellaglioa algida]
MEDLGTEIKKFLKNENLSERYPNVNYRDLMKKVYEDPDVIAFLDKNKAELTESNVQRADAKLYEFLSEKNKIILGKGMIAPGYKPQLVLNNHMIDVSYVPTDALIETQKSKALAKRVKSMSMSKDIKNATMNDFDMDGRGDALSQSLKFITEFVANPNAYHQAMYFYGSFGVGKTYLLGAMANELANRGYQTTLMHFPSFAVEIKNAISDNRVYDMLNAVKKSEILMIDDIGADAMSSWVRDDILGVILQYRMQEELPTFFSSNFSMKQLEDEHLRISQKGEDEPLKAKRIMERVHFLTKEVKIVGKNRRPK